MDPDRHAVEKQLAAVASTLSARVAEVTTDVVDHIIGGIEQLRGDDQILSLLHASVEVNVATILQVFEHGMSVGQVETPAAAIEYARRLAQRGVPAVALIRAYRVGHARFLRWCLDELARQSGEVSLAMAVSSRMVELSAGYIDRASEQVFSAYERERDRWLLTQTAVRASRVRALLEEKHVDADTIEAALGYRLRQHHVGLIVWVPEPTAGGEGLARLERLAAAVAGALGCRDRPLFVPLDESSAWAWLPLGARDDVPWDLLRAAVEDEDPTARIAAGDLAAGVDGFRLTHRQALSARDMSLASGPAGPRTTAFAQAGPIALLCADLDGTRGWVQHTLGSLAIDDEPHARLRETVRVFLATGGSFTAAAEQLVLHKNTVQYRVRKAEEIHGRPFRDDRLQVEVALLACHVLGSAVLQPGPSGR